MSATPSEISLLRDILIAYVKEERRSNITHATERLTEFYKTKNNFFKDMIRNEFADINLLQSFADKALHDAINDIEVILKSSSDGVLDFHALNKCMLDSISQAFPPNRENIISRIKSAPHRKWAQRLKRTDSVPDSSNSSMPTKHLNMLYSRLKSPSVASSVKRDSTRLFSASLFEVNEIKANSQDKPRNPIIQWDFLRIACDIHCALYKEENAVNSRDLRAAELVALLFIFIDHYAVSAEQISHIMNAKSILVSLLQCRTLAMIKSLISKSCSPIFMRLFNSDGPFAFFAFSALLDGTVNIDDAEAECILQHVRTYGLSSFFFDNITATNNSLSFTQNNFTSALYQLQGLACYLKHWGFTFHCPDPPLTQLHSPQNPQDIIEAFEFLGGIPRVENLIAHILAVSLEKEFEQNFKNKFVFIWNAVEAMTSFAYAGRPPAIFPISTEKRTGQKHNKKAKISTLHKFRLQVPSSVLPPSKASENTLSSFCSDSGVDCVSSHTSSLNVSTPKQLYFDGRALIALVHIFDSCEEDIDIQVAVLSHVHRLLIFCADCESDGMSAGAILATTSFSNLAEKIYGMHDRIVFEAAKVICTACLHYEYRADILCSFSVVLENSKEVSDSFLLCIRAVVISILSALPDSHVMLKESEIIKDLAKIIAASQYVITDTLRLENRAECNYEQANMNEKFPTCKTIVGMSAILDCAVWMMHGDDENAAVFFQEVGVAGILKLVETAFLSNPSIENPMDLSLFQNSTLSALRCFVSMSICTYITGRAVDESVDIVRRTDFEMCQNITEIYVFVVRQIKKLLLQNNLELVLVLLSELDVLYRFRGDLSAVQPVNDINTLCFSDEESDDEMTKEPEEAAFNSNAVYRYIRSDPIRYLPTQHIMDWIYTPNSYSDLFPDNEHSDTRNINLLHLVLEKNKNVLEKSLWNGINPFLTKVNSTTGNPVKRFDIRCLLDEIFEKMNGVDILVDILQHLLSRKDNNGLTVSSYLPSICRIICSISRQTSNVTGCYKKFCAVLSLFCRKIYDISKLLKPVLIVLLSGAFDVSEILIAEAFECFEKQNEMQKHWVWDRRCKLRNPLLFFLCIEVLVLSVIDCSYISITGSAKLVEFLVSCMKPIFRFECPISLKRAADFGASLFLLGCMERLDPRRVESNQWDIFQNLVDLLVPIAKWRMDSRTLMKWMQLVKNFDIKGKILLEALATVSKKSSDQFPQTDSLIEDGKQSIILEDVAWIEFGSEYRNWGSKAYIEDSCVFIRNLRQKPTLSSGADYSKLAEVPTSDLWAELAPFRFKSRAVRDRKDSASLATSALYSKPKGSGSTISNAIVAAALAGLKKLDSDIIWKVKEWPPSKGYSFSSWVYVHQYGYASIGTNVPLTFLEIQGEGASFNSPICMTRIELVPRKEGGVVRVLTKSGEHAFNDCLIYSQSWHHICIIHSRSSGALGLGMGSVTLFVNGAEISQGKLAYPEQSKGLHCMCATIGNVTKQVTANEPEKPVCASRWAQGPTYLIDEVISRNSAEQLFAIGPKYTGLFQGEDGWGQIPIDPHICPPKLLTKLLFKAKKGPNKGGQEENESVSRRMEGKSGGSFNGQNRRKLTVAPISASSKKPCIQLNILPSSIVLAASNRIVRAVLKTYNTYNSRNIDKKEANNESDMDDDRLVHSIMSLWKFKCIDRPLSDNVQFPVVITSGSQVPVLGNLCGDAVLLERCTPADALREFQGRVSFPMCLILLLLESANCDESLAMVIEIMYSLLWGHIENDREFESHYGYLLLTHILRQKSSEQLLGPNSISALMRSPGMHFGAPCIVDLPAFKHAVLGIVQSLPDVGEEGLRMINCAMTVENLSHRAFNRQRMRQEKICRQLIYALIDTNVPSKIFNLIIELLTQQLTGGAKLWASLGQDPGDANKWEAELADDLHTILAVLLSTLSKQFNRAHMCLPDHLQGSRSVYEMSMKKCCRRSLRQSLLQVLYKSVKLFSLWASGGGSDLSDATEEVQKEDGTMKQAGLFGLNCLITNIPLKFGIQIFRYCSDITQQGYDEKYRFLSTILRDKALLMESLGSPAKSELGQELDFAPIYVEGFSLTGGISPVSSLPEFTPARPQSLSTVTSDTFSPQHAKRLETARHPRRRDPHSALYMLKFLLAIVPHVSGQILVKTEIFRSISYSAKHLFNAMIAGPLVAFPSFKFESVQREKLICELQNCIMASILGSDETAEILSIGAASRDLSPPSSPVYSDSKVQEVTQTLSNTTEALFRPNLVPAFVNVLYAAALASTPAGLYCFVPQCYEAMKRDESSPSLGPNREDIESNLDAFGLKNVSSELNFHERQNYKGWNDDMKEKAKVAASVLKKGLMELIYLHEHCPGFRALFRQSGGEGGFGLVNTPNVGGISVGLLRLDGAKVSVPEKTVTGLVQVYFAAVAAELVQSENLMEFSADELKNPEIVSIDDEDSVASDDSDVIGGDHKNVSHSLIDMGILDLAVYISKINGTKVTQHSTAKGSKENISSQIRWQVAERLMKARMPSMFETQGIDFCDPSPRNSDASLALTKGSYYTLINNNIPSELPLHFLVTIASDCAIYMSNGMAIVEFILSSIFDLSELSTKGPSGPFFTAQLLEKLYLKMQMTFCRGLLLRIYQNIKESPQILLGKNCKLSTNLPRMLDIILSVLYAHQHYFQNFVSSEESANYKVFNECFNYKAHLETVFFSNEILRIWRKSVESDCTLNDEIGDSTSKNTNIVQGKKGGIMDSFFEAFLFNGPTNGGKGGKSKQGGLLGAQVPDWGISAQAVTIRIINMILSNSADVSGEILLATLAEVKKAAISGFLVPSQWSIPNDPHTNSLELSPAKLISHLSVWERECLSELCRHLYSFLYNDMKPVRESSMGLWRVLLLTKAFRSFIDGLLTVSSQSFVIGRDGNSLDGFGLLMRQGPWDENSGGIGVHPAYEFQMWLGGLDEATRESLDSSLEMAAQPSQLARKNLIGDSWSICSKRWDISLARYGLISVAVQKSISARAKAVHNQIQLLQDAELIKQVRWRQEQLDLLKYSARTWTKIKKIAESSLDPSNSIADDDGDWCLDFTEGPSRMRTKVSKSGQKLIVMPRGTKPVKKLSMTEYRIKGLKELERLASFEAHQGDYGLYEESLDLESLGGSIGVTESESWSVSSTDDSECYYDSSESESRKRASHRKGRRSSQSLNQQHRISGESPTMELGQCNTPEPARSRANSRQGRSLSNTSLAQTPAKSKNENESSEDDSADENSIGRVDHKLLPLLQPGDKILKKHNCELVRGMDTQGGILLICRDNFYMIENYRFVSRASNLIERDRNFSGFDMLSASFQSIANRGDKRKVAQDSRVEIPRLLSWEENNGVDGEVRKFLSADEPISHAFSCWNYSDIYAVHRRRYLLRPLALEVFMEDGSNFLLTLESKDIRESIYSEIVKYSSLVESQANQEDLSSRDIFYQGRLKPPYNVMEKWQLGIISNFEYLMHLNTLADRSYNDLTQYPVFPWILADYTSDTLDLSNPKTFRDLRKPMGALNPAREKAFRDRFDSMFVDKDDPYSVPKFHYGTHYSSAAIVLHYLIRLQPFSSQAVQMQGGKFDHADRLFHSIEQAWSASSGISSNGDGDYTTTQDVKELIPEFFYLPAFLENRNGYNFGTLMDSDCAVDNVVLPPWANNSAREFIRMHRQALESDFVSANLNYWIDLIFGSRQHGELAEQSCNVFFHLTYEGAVDLEAIENSAESAALIHQIHEFGQTPTQLFLTPHPSRLPPAFHGMQGSEDLDPDLQLPLSPRKTRYVSSCPNQLSAVGSRVVRSTVNSLLIMPAKNGVQPQVPMLLPGLNSISSVENFPLKPECVVGDICCPIGSIASREKEGGVYLSVNAGCLLLPPFCQEFIAYGFLDCTFRLCSVGSYEGGIGDSSVLQTVDTELGPVGNASVSFDGHALVTSRAILPLIDVWRIRSQRTGGSAIIHISTLSTDFHEGPVQSLAVSHAFSIAVSICSITRWAVLWDIARGKFSRTLSGTPLSGSGATPVMVDNKTGYFAICSSNYIYYFDVNGDLLCTVETSSIITSCFIGSTPDSTDGSVIIATGHLDGTVRVWNAGEKGACQVDHAGDLNLEHECAVITIHISSDFKRILSGDVQGNVFVYMPPPIGRPM